MPARGEYTNVKAASNAASRTSASVSSKSSSVSPGKPAMRSVVMLTSGTAPRSARDALEVLGRRVAAPHGRAARGRSPTAPAGARARTRSGSSAIAAMRSSREVLGVRGHEADAREAASRRARAAAPAKSGAASPPRAQVARRRR